jgi:hypothetical protein
LVDNTKKAGESDASESARSGDDAWKRHRQQKSSAGKSLVVLNRQVAPPGNGKPRDSEAGRYDSKPAAEEADDILDELTQARRVAQLSDAQASVGNIAVYRHGMTETFVDGFFPKDPHSQSMVGVVMAQWLLPRSATMQAGNDACALLQLATVTGDQALMLAARRRHLATVEMVRKELANQSIANFLGLLGAAQELLICELYTVVSAGPDSWKKHMPGIMAIVRHVSAEEQPTPFHLFLFKCLRLCGLMHGLVLRKALSLSCPIRHETTSRGDIQDLLNIALNLPLLLERTDGVKYSHR